VFFELIVNFERVRKKIFFLLKFDFLNFMALNKVISENLLHTFEVLYQGNVTLKFLNFYYFFNRVNRADDKTYLTRYSSIQGQGVLNICPLGFGLIPITEYTLCGSMMGG
jgi:hypothetical protein